MSFETKPGPLGRLRPRKRSQSGCGFLFFACFISSILLLVNGILVIAALSIFDPNSALLDQPRVSQAILVVFPVVLVFVEWRIIDWLFDLFGRSA